MLNRQANRRVSQTVSKWNIEMEVILLHNQTSS